MSEPAILLRRASRDDVAALRAVQQAAFAWNREILGVEPLPLLADYGEVVATKECWFAEDNGLVQGAIILEPEGEALLVWSVAGAPEQQGAKLGRHLMAFAEDRAREQGIGALTLYTGEKLQKNIDWYQRLGFSISGIEALADRNIVHMKKPVSA